jgi:hypothetical protein
MTSSPPPMQYLSVPGGEKSQPSYQPFQKMDSAPRPQSKVIYNSPAPLSPRSNYENSQIISPKANHGSRMIQISQ